MIRSTQKKIAVYYPAFLGGGAETVGLWMLEALKDNYDLTLFTIAQVDFERLNTMYGTTLSATSIQVHPLFSQGLNSVLNNLIANNANVRMFFFHLLLRRLKAEKDKYDLLISAYNAADLGKRSIQYIHWVKVLEGNPFYERISRFSMTQLQSNLSLVNSQVVAGAVKKTYGCDATVLYPPVVLDLPDSNWADKENAFICSGRITVSKQPDQVIKILKKVRERGFDIQLYLTGGGGGAYAWKYEAAVKQLVQENSDWVTLYENLSYRDYVNVMAKCKYGIHYKKEPFGISIAEMVKAGAIPFVRSQGGQIEIVGVQNQDLLFENEQEAIEKIVAVLSHPEKQTQLQAALATQKHLFSTQRFMVEMNRVVAQFLDPSFHAGIDWTGTLINHPNGAPLPHAKPEVATEV